MPSTHSPIVTPLNSQLLRESTVLILDDHKKSRSALSRFFKRDGTKVRKSHVGKRAIRVALEDPSVKCLVADIAMPGKVDGIDAAIEVQRERPEVGCIIVTAYSGNREYRERVKRSGLRVAQWYSKPLNKGGRSNLRKTVQEELLKVRIREAIREGSSHGILPLEALDILEAYDHDLPTSLVEEVRAEMTLSPDEEIDGLYRQIETLEAQAPDSAIERELRLARKRLRELQSREADRMERLLDWSSPLKRGSGYSFIESLKKGELEK